MSNGKVPDIGDLVDSPPTKGTAPPDTGQLEEVKGQSKRADTAKEFMGGALQGAVFDPVTGINQLIEHASNNKIGLPNSVKNWLENYKKEFTSTTAGKWGQGAGTVGSFFVPGGAIVKGVGFLPKAGRTLTALERAAIGAGMGGAGALMQPVEEGKDFTKAKEGQLLGGTVTGGLAGPAAIGGSGLMITKLAHQYGWGPVIGIISSLGYLAARHGDLHHPISGAVRGVGKVFDRPTAQYAAGRAAGAYAPDAVEEMTGDR